jgi:DNA-binding MarR family transcriptional regulator
MVKKMIRQTSLESYRKCQPTLGKKQAEMLDVFKDTTSCTDRDLAKILGWSINTVTPRRNELAAKGLIVEDGIIFDGETKRKATLWRLKR